MTKKLEIGDAVIYFKSATKMSELPDASVNLIITSPPYWSLKDYGVVDQIGLGSGTFETYLIGLNEVWAECVRVLAPDGKFCINIMPILLTGTQAAHGRRETKLLLNEIEQFMTSTGVMFQFGLYIWDKRKIARFSSFGSYPYPPNIFSTFPYEWITVFSKAGKRPKVDSEVKKKSRLTTKEWQDWAVNSIWEMQPAKAKSEGHPAPFPVELPRRIIKLHSFWGDLVLDPFMGSGTTALAALELSRRVVGYELNESFSSLAEKKLGGVQIGLPIEDS
jgi:site-specific DNA-methyltransferase (adenine-specific)